MSLLREYALAMVGFIATLILTLIAEFVLKLSDEGTYLTFAMGAFVTLAITLLEKNLEKRVGEAESAIEGEISQKLELYKLLASIDDPRLQSQVIQLAKELSKGEIPHHITALRSRELLASVQTTLWASEYAKTSEGVYEFEDNTRRKTWYDGALQALRRGVVVEQIFILQKSSVINDGQWDQRALRILKEIASAGIAIRVLWLEELGGRPPLKNLVQDFAIFDGKEVVVEESRYSTRTYRAPSERVQEYQEIFEEQRKFSQSLGQLLTEYEAANA